MFFFSIMLSLVKIVVSPLFFLMHSSPLFFIGHLKKLNVSLITGLKHCQWESSLPCAGVPSNPSHLARQLYTCRPHLF